MISQCRLYDVIARQVQRSDTSQATHIERSITHTLQRMLLQPIYLALTSTVRTLALSTGLYTPALSLSLVHSFGK